MPLNVREYFLSMLFSFFAIRYMTIPPIVGAIRKLRHDCSGYNASIYIIYSLHIELRFFQISQESGTI